MSQDGTFVYRAEKSQEWFTPARYIEAARQTMGGIDLDPASCAEANLIVKAEHYYTKEDNGLLQEWSHAGRSARVWCNPPYGRSLNYNSGNAGLFAKKLLTEYHDGHIEQAVLLTTVQNDARWFQPLWQFPICFSNHRIHFYTTHPTKKNPTATHMFGTAFVYVGSNIERFTEMFARFGVVVPAMVAYGTQQDLWTMAEEASMSPDPAINRRGLHLPFNQNAD